MSMLVRFWFLVLFSSFLFGEVLPGFIQNKINQYKFKKNELAIYIKETGKNRTVASLNIDKKMTPASVVKVYSIYAALLELGYDYRWPTMFYYTGRLKNGTVTGDLVVKGYGDPTLNSRDLPGIVSALKAKGIRRIKGNIIIDRSYFMVPKRDSSHFDQNIYSPYNAMPDAMMFNQHTSKFSIVSKNGRYQVQKSIPGDSYHVVNNLRTVPGSCRGSRSWPRIKVDHSTETPVLHVSGKLSRQCRKRTIRQIVTKPYKEFYAALKQQMKKSGIDYNGHMKVREVPSGAKKIYTHYSPRLEQVISITAKKSNNLFARHLMLTLGAKIYGPPANLDKGRRAVVQILNRYRLLDTPKCHIDNGCGLSRVSKITARSMANVLDHAYKNYGIRWMKILSIAGQDGTIKRRFRSTIVKNRAWMKTGTLNKVKNISGYVKSRSGKLYTVVILVNSKRARYLGAKLQNDIMKWLVTYRGSGVKIDIDSLPDALKAGDDLWRNIDVNKPSGYNKRIFPAASNGKSYFVQVGSFGSDPDNRFLGKLKNSGYTYRIVKDQSRSKVMVGPYRRRADAVKALKRLQKQVKSAYVTQL